MSRSSVGWWGVDQDADPPDEGLAGVEVVVVAGRCSARRSFEGVAAGEGVVDDGDEGGPPAGCDAGRLPGAAPTRSGSRGVQVVVRVWSSSTWAATAGERCPVMRHHRAARGVVVRERALGQGPAEQGGGVEAGAGDRGEPFGEQRGERVGAGGGRRTWSRSGLHSASAGVRSPARRALRRSCHRWGGRAELGGPVGRRSVGVDLRGGPPDRDVDEQVGGGAALSLACPCG